MRIALSTKLWHQQPHPKVAESENIGVNHLGFVKSLFQHYCQHLGLNHNHISVESAFNFYVNERIAYLLGIPVNTESAREIFYSKLIQNTSLSTNYNFTSIITEINKEIKHHTQQRYPITYASKGKKKLQILAKTRIELPTAPSYHYILGSAINITSASTSTSNAISTFGQFSFQKNPKIKTPNIQAPQNQKPEVIYQYLPPVIIINQPPIEPIGQPIQTLNQQNQQPLPQQQQITYTPIAKLDKFTGKKDDAQVWLNDIEKAITANGWNDTRATQAIPYFLKNTIDSWYQSLVDKPQDFNTFKLEFLKYFNNNNSINRLANTFTTIKQGETEAVTTYLGCFHRNLRQIQAIDANYFTAPQIFNQFIRGLHSSILQHVCPLHLATLQDAVTHTRDFESAKLEANHAHAVNLVMNGSSKLDFKLKQFTAPNQPWQQKHVFATTVISGSELLPKLRPISNHLPANNAATNLLTASISTSNLSTTAISNLLATTPNNLSALTTNEIQDLKSLKTGDWRWLFINQFPAPLTNHQALDSGIQNYLSLLVTSEDAQTNKPETNPIQKLTSNILPAIVTENETLAAIFPFEFEKTTPVPLFSRATFEEKPITAMYTNAKVDGHSIKLILNSGLAGSIIMQQLINQLGR
ncbi:hypothetical protein G9A89_016146 [Geosiphon pyriformis]|nr:hypothetical protein G9A89_016146 [Geosiphon pyriformis]